MAKTKTKTKPRSPSNVRYVPARLFIDCRVMSLPKEQVFAARETALAHNPANDVSTQGAALANRMSAKVLAALLNPYHIAVMTQKYWGREGVKLGVTFLDNPTAGTRRKILTYANKWAERCNIQFAESSQGQVRVTRDKTGYWSYLGTDILHIAAGQATMNLQEFTEDHPSDSEYERVVPHEFGHTCGCPHEHARRAIIDLLDPMKTIRYFQRMYGWNAATTKQQVLTPVEESSLVGGPSDAGPTDQDSTMCYGFAGECTKSGRAIIGGSKITDSDYTRMAQLYPRSDIVVPPPPDGGDTGGIQIALNDKVVVAPAGWTLVNR